MKSKIKEIPEYVKRTFDALDKSKLSAQDAFIMVSSSGKRDSKKLTAIVNGGAVELISALTAALLEDKNLHFIFKKVVFCADVILAKKKEDCVDK
jgi:hypothetical protein